MPIIKSIGDEAMKREILNKIGDARYYLPISYASSDMNLFIIANPAEDFRTLPQLFLVKKLFILND